MPSLSDIRILGTTKGLEGGLCHVERWVVGLAKYDYIIFLGII